MDKDKVVVVSGQPRSGTSLMMQTMEILGLPIWGEKYPMEKAIRQQLGRLWWLTRQGRRAHKQAHRRLKHAKKMNPRGFYEIGGIVMRGFRKLPEDKEGHVVKVIVDGLYDRKNLNGHKMGTPEKLIDKVILCLRDPRRTAVSQTELTGNVEVAGVDEDTGEEVWENAGQALSPQRYVFSMGNFVKWLVDHEELDDRILVMDFEDMHENQPVERIVEHLGLTGVNGQVEKAKGNIDPLLRRSTDFPGWGENDMEGALTEDIHAALKAWDRSQFKNLAARAEEMMHNWRLEGVRWVDTERGTWVTVNAEVYRKGGIDPLHPVLIPMSPEGCKYFSKGDDTYTVERPVDLGDLTRHMVQCNRDDNQVTVERCKRCWQRGSQRDGEFLEGQRHREGAK